MEEDEGQRRQVCFTGPSGSGKTTLIEKVLPLLSQAGLRVAVVKHTHHRNVSNKPGKDSWRFDRAGACRVLLVTPELIYFQHHWGLEVATDPDLLLAGCDLVIHEGGRGLAHPKVLVCETAEEALARGTNGQVLAVVESDSGGLPRFGRDDPTAVSCFLQRLATGDLPTKGTPAIA